MPGEELGQGAQGDEVEVAGLLERGGPVDVKLRERSYTGGAEFVQLRVDWSKRMQQVSSGILRQRRKVGVGSVAQAVLNSGPVQGATSLWSHPCVPNHELAGVFEREPDVSVDLPTVANRVQQRCLDEVLFVGHAGGHVGGPVELFAFGFEFE